MAIMVGITPSRFAIKDLELVSHVVDEQLAMLLLGFKQSGNFLVDQGL